MDALEGTCCIIYLILLEKNKTEEIGTFLSLDLNVSLYDCGRVCVGVILYALMVIIVFYHYILLDI